MSSGYVFKSHAPYRITSIRDDGESYWYSKWVGKLSNNNSIVLKYQSGVIEVIILDENDRELYKYSEILPTDSSMMSLEEILEYFTDDILILD